MDFDLQKHLIYQDTHLVILNKPSGLRVIPDGYRPELPYLKKFMGELFKEVYVVHRLDKDTSGVMIMALNKETHRKLNHQFSNRLINKKYISVSLNIPKWSYLSHQSKIKVDADRNHRTVEHSEGKRSQTDFYVLKTNKIKNISTIISGLKTGYTHQIRSHLSSLGFPILGDPLYKNRLNPLDELPNNLIHRTALHALKIVFYHPVLNQRLCFEAPIPDDIQNLIDLN